MKEIESSSNPRIVAVRRMRRRRPREVFLLEGRKLLLEAIHSKVVVTEIFATREVWNQERKLLQDLERSGSSLFTVTGRLMALISDMETPPGLVAVARAVTSELPVLPSRFGAFCIAIRDPGNFGSIVRSAEAAGCDFVAHTSDCVDPFQPKVIRASMGSMFRVPLHEVQDAVMFLQEMKQKGVMTYGLSPRNGNSVFEIALNIPALLVIGSESQGLPGNISVDHSISIPMAGKVESLNAAIASAVCFYWFSTFRIAD